MLYVQANSQGHVGTLPPFLGLLPKVRMSLHPTSVWFEILTSDQMISHKYMLYMYMYKLCLEAQAAHFSLGPNGRGSTDYKTFSSEYIEAKDKAGCFRD